MSNLSALYQSLFEHHDQSIVNETLKELAGTMSLDQLEKLKLSLEEHYKEKFNT